MDTPPDPRLAPDAATHDPVMDRAAERVARHCRILAELAEIGLRLTQALERRAAGPDPVSDAGAETASAADDAAGPVAAPVRGDRGLSFDRLTRAIRLTLMLETRIDEGEVARQAQAAQVRAKAAKAAQDATADAWAERQTAGVLEVVEQTLEADGQDDEIIIERLRETREYLESGDEDFDIVELPTGLVIAHICKAFGLEPDWSLWAEADWAIEEAQDGMRGSPFVRRGFGGGGSAAPPGAEAELAAPVSGSP